MQETGVSQMAVLLYSAFSKYLYLLGNAYVFWGMSFLSGLMTVDAKTKENTKSWSVVTVS